MRFKKSMEDAAEHFSKMGYGEFRSYYTAHDYLDSSEFKQNLKDIEGEWGKMFEEGEGVGNC